MTEAKRKQLKGRVFEIQKQSLRKCLEPTETCSEPAIHAHSIQNAHILDQLCEDGHVMMPKMQYLRSGEPELVLERVGRKKATTFTGLCSTHDQTIFDPIDRASIDLTNDEQLFLLAHRSVLRELHAASTAAANIQRAFQEKVALDLVNGDIPTPEGLLAVRQLDLAYDCYRYKREYDAALVARSFEAVEHLFFVESGWSPTLSVSSLFSIDHIRADDDVVRTVLNVYPS